MPTKTADQEPAAAPANGRRRLVLLAVPVLLLAGAWFLLLGPGSGKGAAEAKAPVPGEVLPLEAITMNLADGRLLKVGLALQLREGAGEEHPVSGSLALDEAITFLGEHTYAELAAPAARAAAKATLSERVSERYHSDVLEVYFTEFVMQ